MWIFVMVVWQLTGNVGLGGWLMYITTPIYNHFFVDNKRNVAVRNEKAFIKSSMFTFPCYAIIFVYFACQIYLLCLYSTNWKPDLPIFRHQHETYFDLLMLVFTLGFFSVLGNAASHEIGHWPETHNKIMGFLPYVSIFYSHFQNDHNLGHHKNICTPLDPCSHPKYDNIYTGPIKAMFMTNVNTWYREQTRLQVKYKQEPSFFTSLTENKMIPYKLMEVAMVYGVYQVFGIGGLKCQIFGGLVGYLWMEMINYITHYGLIRK